MKSVDKDNFRRKGVDCKVVMMIMTHTKGLVEGRGGYLEMEEEKYAVEMGMTEESKVERVK